MKKLNIGAGFLWYEDGWETLDNAPLKKKKKKYWQHYGKCWDTKLKKNSYDLIFSSHMLEHVPHFRLEKTISEFNRLLKKNGRLRIAVPNLRKAAKAYVNKNYNFFKKSVHYSNHLGIGASFLRVMISPGGQSIVMNREMDEILGGYAHLYSFDYEMLRILLKKWGFKNIYESNPGKSKILEMQKLQHAIIDDKKYILDFKILKKMEEMKINKIKYCGFDKISDSQLIVEATKSHDVGYSYDNEYEFNKNSRIDSIDSKIKIYILYKLSKLIDLCFSILMKLRINKIIRLIFRKKKL